MMPEPNVQPWQGGEGVDVKEGVIGTIIDGNVVQMQLDGDSGGERFTA